ncbi:MAG: hypothetical protein ACD_45C00008G0008 [uncultured bacterium]|nr:MAG: hypothetical protein ACD_45C00008G0008 [uncultured bacterium]
MKRILIGFFTLFLCFFSLAVYALETYNLDPNHTYLLWHTSHFGFSEQSGKWPASGVLLLDEKNPENSKVNVTVRIEDLATSLAEFDKHLKGKLFLNVEQFPVATFVSDKIVVTGKKTAKVTGMLTLHGVTKSIMLSVKFNKKGINPVNDKETVGFSATTTLKRSDFGMTALLPGVGDDVKIEIEAEASKAKGNE